METISLSVTEARREFCHLVSKASRGERYLVGRKGKPVAALISAAELSRLEDLAQQAATTRAQRQATLERIAAWQAHLQRKYGIMMAAADDLAAAREVRTDEQAGS
jgi:prevent-host-death family protein